MPKELDLAEMAKVSRLFEALDAAGRHRLLGLSQRLHKKAGEVICREGDEGGEFYVLASGEVRVAADSLEGEKELARLHHGQSFSGMAAPSAPPPPPPTTPRTPFALSPFPPA